MFTQKLSILFLAAFIFLTSATILSAQSPDQTTENLKTITLKDGTKIKGKLIGVQDNTYSIETNYFGRINVKDSDVVSISNTDIQPASTAHGSVPSPVAGQSIKGHLEALQGQMMADPEFVSSIQELTQDPKFVELLQDPEFVNVIMSQDPQKIQNNPKIQILLQDPKMQKLIQRMSQKHLGNQ